MLSRFITACLKSSPIFKTRLNQLSFNQFSNFAAQKKQTNPFHFKIIQITSNYEFFNFFNQNQELFDSHSFAVAAKTLGRLIFQNRSYVKFNTEDVTHLKVFLQKLKATNLSELNTLQYMSFLQLSRTMKNKEINSRQIRDYIQFLKRQTPKIIPKITNETVQLYQLGYFYNQISSLDIKQSSLIAQKIVQNLQQQKQENQTNSLTPNIIIQILSGMKNKQQISYPQKKLLGYITKKVNQQLLQKLSFYDLVRIAGYLNETIDNMGQRAVNYNINTIFNRILSNIDELDQKSIMFILSGQLTNNQIYRNIYFIIFQKIFDEIQPSGRSSFSQLFTMKIFAAISSKIKLYKTSQTNQKKLLAFLQSSILKNPKFISIFVRTMVENNFFSRSHLQKLVDILLMVSEEFIIPLSILFNISSKNVNLKDLLKIDQEKVMKLKNQSLLMYGQILREQQKLNKGNQLIKQTLEKLRTLTSGLIDTPQKFVQFVFKVSDKSMLYSFNSAFGKVYSEKQYWKTFELQNASRQFKNAFLMTLVFGTYPQQIARKNQTIRILNLQDVLYLLKIPTNVINHNKYAISNILSIASEKINLIVQNPQSISILGRFLNENGLQVRDQAFSQYGMFAFWNILKKLIMKNSSQIFIKVNKLIRALIVSGHIQFKNSLGYYNFIQLLLQNQQSLQKFNKIHFNLINQSLRLGALTKETASKIPQQLIEKLQYKNKMLLSIVVNPKEYNPFQGKQFNMSNLNLHLAISNSANMKVIQLEKENILKYIQQKIKPFEALQCIINYRAIYSKTGRQILAKLMDNLNIKVKNYQSMNYLGICHLVKNYPSTKSLKSIRLYFQKALQYFSNEFSKNRLSIQQNLQLISRASESRAINIQYMKKVFKNYQEGLFYMNFKQLILLYSRIGYSFDKQELQCLKKQHYFSKSYSFFKSLKIFLLLENSIQDPKVILNNIIQRSKNEHEFQIPLIYLKYLQAKYPQQTREWQPKTNQYSQTRNITQTEGGDAKNLLFFKSEIQKICNETLVQKQVFNNTYFKLRNTCFVFFSNNKYPQETKLLLKLMKQFSDDKDSNYIALNSRAYVWSILKFIDKEQTNLFSEQQKKSFNNPKKQQKQNEQQQQEEHDHLP